MQACENLSKCPFYQDQMQIDSAIGSMYKKRYCEGDKSLCARYAVASQVGKQFVPANLYPNMLDKAKEIIASHKK